MNVGVWGIGCGPDGELYAMGTSNNMDSINRTIYHFSPGSNIGDPIFTGPATLPNLMIGFIAMGNGIFYTMSQESDLVYKWDINAGTVVIIGATGYPLWGDICTSNGAAYYISRNYGPPVEDAKIINLDLANPANSIPIATFDNDYGFYGITASVHADILLGLEIDLAGSNADLYEINLLDGGLTLKCTHANPGNHFGGFVEITSPLEHGLLAFSDVLIDLDCDDSSGATDADYNSPSFDCLSGGVGIADFDLVISTDALIDELTVDIASAMPDAPYEKLEVVGPTPGIMVSGAGTPFIRFINLGNASIQNFIDAVHSVVYKDLAEPVTPGQRTIDVQFTSYSGTESNIAQAFVEVLALPPTVVDLGSDLQPCDGESIELIAGDISNIYFWSTGEMTNGITVTETGTYEVTVSGPHTCPATDLILVEFLPVIHVWLTGDTAACLDQLMQIEIATDAEFPIDVTITPDPGPPIEINDIANSFTFYDFLFETTEFEITQVNPSSPACIELPDAEQTVEVWPDYIDVHQTISICFGDSIQLGGIYYDTSGTYPVLLTTIHGCDSMVYYHLDIAPAEHIFMMATTCDSSLAGTVISYLHNTNGCDTVVHTNNTLLPNSITFITETSCTYSNAGIKNDTLSNQYGCDSILVTTILYQAPTDTTEMVMNTCDSSEVSITYITLIKKDGCDSLIRLVVTIPNPDTTYVNLTSCDPNQIGTTETWWHGMNGCDSLVIQSVTPGVNDTLFTTSTSCDSANLGIFTYVFPKQNQCDSIVINEIVYALADSVFQFSNTCQPLDTGLFIMTLVNQFGCDSLIFEKINLLPSYSFMFQSASCFPLDTGIFIEAYTTVQGCDSVITNRISLYPSDTTLLISRTCDISQAGEFILDLQNQYGCDSTVILQIEYIKPDTTILESFSCFQDEVGEEETNFENVYGCDSVLVLKTSLFPPAELQLVSNTDYHGYEISCFGENDASISALVDGPMPFQFDWSTGEHFSTIDSLMVGTYSILVTDGNGCITTGEYIVEQPESIRTEFIVSAPACFADSLGTIDIKTVGGVPPYEYSKDGIQFTDNPVFSELEEGAYVFFIRDKNECITSEIVAIHLPKVPDVELGEPQTIALGDSFLLEATINIPYALLDSILWDPFQSSPCQVCLSQLVSPIVTTAYKVEIITDEGCRDEDQLTITVETTDDIFVPNVFSPNGDGINDLVFVYARPLVKSILTFRIFDRWGNEVYEARDFTSQQNQVGWDGKFHAQYLDPGVYTYYLLAERKDGVLTSKHGDITLLR